MEGLFGAAFAAAAAGDWDGVQSLLSCGIIATCSDHEGNTLLHAAVRSGNAGLVQVRRAGPHVSFFFFHLPRRNTLMHSGAGGLRLACPELFCLIS